MGMFALRVQEPGAARAGWRLWPRQPARIAPNQIVGRLRIAFAMCSLTVIAFIELVSTEVISHRYRSKREKR
jgi:hypothetical protein